MNPTPEDLHTFLRTRRSVRRFKPDPVPDSVLASILHTATFAPSAHNRKPWRFCVVTDSAVKKKFAEEMAKKFEKDLKADNIPQDAIRKRIARSKERILAAPVVIVLSADMSETDSYPDKRRKKAEQVMATQSVANAGLQLLLAAHAEGLGGVWVCAPLFAPRVAQKILGLPKSWEPQAMFFIGYP